MTVQDLIDALNIIEDKAQAVCLREDQGLSPVMMDTNEIQNGGTHYYVYAVGTVEGKHIILG